MVIFGVPLFSLLQAQNVDIKINFGLLSCFLWYRAFHSLGWLFLLHFIGPSHTLADLWWYTHLLYGNTLFLSDLRTAVVGFPWGGLGSCGGLSHNSHSGFSELRGGQNLLWEKSTYLQRPSPSSAVSTPSTPTPHPVAARRDCVCIFPNRRGTFSF